MTIGQRIKKRRTLLNIGQSDLAKSVNISKQTLYKYENDIVTNIPSDKIQHLADALDTTPAYLMGWEDDPISYDPDKVEKAIKLYEQFSSLTPEYQTVLLDMIEAAQIAADLRQTGKDKK